MTFALFSILSTRGYGQVDSTSSSRKSHSPRQALLLSALLPGAGQAYNKKYWKIPVLYAGAGLAGYFMLKNYKQYSLWREAFIARSSPGQEFILNPTKYPASRFNDLAVMRRHREYYRRSFEQSVILMVALYALNIIDANVNAHLKGFQLGNEQLTFSPAVGQTGVGFSLALTVK